LGSGELSEPSSFLVAHGLGQRVQALTSGGCKGLLPLDSSVSIASNLLSACRTAGLDPVIVGRPDDPRLQDLAALGELQLRSPRGYINDVSFLSRDMRDIIIVDCDTVASPDSIRAAVGALLTSRADLAMVLSASPVSEDPRAIRPIVSNGRLVGLSQDVLRARTAGMYRFRGGILDTLRMFAAAQRGTFHDLLALLVEWRVAMETHVIDIAFNVNRDDDYAAAVSWWRGRSEEPGHGAVEPGNQLDDSRHQGGGGL